MLQLSRIVSVGLLLALLSGCASTTFRSTWSDPQAKPIRFQRTLAVFMSPNEGVRRASEDQLVQFIGPARSAASYTLLSRADLDDTERAKEKVRAAGFDGAVVMRVIGERQEVTALRGAELRGSRIGLRDMGRTRTAGQCPRSTALRARAPDRHRTGSRADLVRRERDLRPERHAENGDRDRRGRGEADEGAGAAAAGAVAARDLRRGTPPAGGRRVGRPSSGHAAFAEPER